MLIISILWAGNNSQSAASMTPWVLSTTTSASGKMIYTFNPNPQRWRQGDGVSKVSLGYVLRLRPLWIIWDPVSKPKRSVWLLCFVVIHPYVNIEPLPYYLKLNARLIATYDIWWLVLFQEYIVADTAFFAVITQEVICCKRLKLCWGHAALSALS